MHTMICAFSLSKWWPQNSYFRTFLCVLPSKDDDLVKFYFGMVTCSGRVF